MKTMTDLNQVPLIILPSLSAWGRDLNEILRGYVMKVTSHKVS